MEKNVKRFFVLGIIGMFMVVFMSSFVMAADYTESANSFIAGLGKGTATVLGPLFGDVELLTRIFLAALLAMVVHSVVITMFSSIKSRYRWAITGIITALALIGLPSAFLEAIRIQYGAMGAAILLVIPFIIVLVFSLRARNILIARVTWIFYAFYYLAMYLYKFLIEGFEGGWANAELIPYLVGFAAGVMIFIFLNPLRNLIFRGEIEGIKEKGMESIESGKLLKNLQKKELESYTAGEAP